ncbi:hypothetical protein [Segniliparus rugosus]|uniref:Chitinase n=1 Tax=Segniliparus rugosus (strain ATCC BAA-974 / DSM 45345 / CCUG 50838 / CIP 108380 / JCM 13579 / CDC 945) TaxID=679197 RepID=E5XQC8_SEGRC|nr:hypothetical protein [Segniliparus rugosus]EFV13449.2 hypothetical protein HMPREF9336_01700 [Segniliparus rugosus ATCC BAA-974]
MADKGREILLGPGSIVNAGGQSVSAEEAFGWYYYPLLMWWDQLAACRGDFAPLDFSQLKRQSDWQYYAKAYLAEEDIDLKAFRDTAQTLKTAGANAQLQFDLIRETENLNQHWNDPAQDSVLENYKRNQRLMERDQKDLAGHAQDIAQVAEHLEVALKEKCQAAKNAVDKLINQALRNNVEEFKDRLRTAHEAMKANTKGGGWIGFSTNQHPYWHHGPPGDTWNANDIRNDIQNNVINAFAVTCKALDDADAAVKKVIEDGYNMLLAALGAGDGASSPILSAEAVAKALHKDADDPKFQEFYNLAKGAMEKNGITDPKAQCAFLATLYEESNLQPVEEGGDEAYYRSFLGDDWQYHGRGYIQITHSATYGQLGEWLRSHGYPNADPLGHPEELINNPEESMAAAAWFWTQRDLSDVASSGDPSAAFTEVTARVNGTDSNGQIAARAHYGVRAEAYNALVDGFRQAALARGETEEQAASEYPYIETQARPR